jgi:hypothetical protein
MLRISDFDWPRVLYTRTAAILLGIAALFSILAVIITHSNVDPSKLSPEMSEAVSWAGAAAAFGFFPLLICMGFFWLRCDESSKVNRTIWFVLLLVGFAYGTQIAYYAIVYLPAVLRRVRDHEIEAPAAEPLQAAEDGHRIGPFSRALFIGWVVLLLPVIGTVVLPRVASPHTELIAAIFLLGSLLVIAESILHFIVSLYRSGISRPNGSGSRISSHRKHRG